VNQLENLTTIFNKIQDWSSKQPQFWYIAFFWVTTSQRWWSRNW